MKKVTSKSIRFETCLVSLKDEEELLDTGILICFKGPNSFTGEDLLSFRATATPDSDASD